MKRKMKWFLLITTIIALAKGVTLIDITDAASEGAKYVTELVEKNPGLAENIKSIATQTFKNGTEALVNSITDVVSTNILDQIPSYKGYASVKINNNIPYFTDIDRLRTDAFEVYSELDSLGRCGVAYVNACNDLMPTEERGEIGSIKPSGWNNIKYNGYVEGNYIYNRCHLIGYQLSAENANYKNLITGTRYMNCDGMLPYEDLVAEYVESTGNHVLYRATPVFEGDNLVASGVLLEAWSVEDNGTGICFCVYCFNVQPGIEINYSDGTSKLLEGYTGEYAVNTYYSTKEIRLYDYYQQ